MAHLLTFYAALSMNKAFLQLFVFLVLFFGCWFFLSRVDFVRLFNIEQHSKSTEKKLGDLIYASIEATGNEEFDSASVATLNEIKLALCTKNDLDTAGIKIHLVKSKDVNAFALPDGHLVVYTGLIADCQSAEELSGALGHEIAHIEHRHVMKKLITEIGLSVIVAATAGKSSPGILNQITKLLSSTAYERKLETDADKTSVDYLCKADIDPDPFANLLYRLGSDDGKGTKQLDWISSHPDSEKRSTEVVQYIKSKKNVVRRPLMSTADWDAFKEKVKDL